MRYINLPIIFCQIWKIYLNLKKVLIDMLLLAYFENDDI